MREMASAREVRKWEPRGREHLQDANGDKEKVNSRIK